MGFGVVKLAMAALICAGLAGCAPQGAAKRDPFNSPLRKDYVQLITISDRLVEVDSAGKKVRVSAPEGLCIPTQSIQTFRDSVFMVVDGCRGALSPFGGVVSINVANGPLAADLAAMEAHFRTVEGQVGLGYGGDEEDGSEMDVDGEEKMDTTLDDDDDDDDDKDGKPDEEESDDEEEEREGSAGRTSIDNSFLDSFYGFIPSGLRPATRVKVRMQTSSHLAMNMRPTAENSL